MVLARVATLEELETVWSLDDMARANAMLGAKAYLESEMIKKAVEK